MKKRLLAFLMCAVMIFAGLPVVPLSLSASVTASAAGVETASLQQLYDSIPLPEKWNSLFLDSSTLRLWYDEAATVLADPDSYSQNYVNNIERSLKNAYDSISYHTQNIAITDASVKVNVGSSYVLKAVLDPDDAADKITWSSADENVVSVSASGEVTAKKYSATPVTVTAESNGHSDTCKVYTLNPIGSVTLTAPSSLYEGQSQTFTAKVIGKDASADTTDDYTLTWDSSDASVASVSDSGAVTARKTGTTVITVTAKSSSGSFSAKSNLRVDELIEITSLSAVTVTTAGKLLMNIDQTIDFKVSINPTNASVKNLQWTSSDTSIVSVTDKGYSGSTAIASLKANNPGTVTLKFAAKDGSGTYGTVKVTVQPRISSISIEKMKVVAPTVKTETVNVTILPKDAGNQVLSWSSSNPDICDVDYSGRLIPKSLGVCTIYVKTTDGSNLSGECKVRVASLSTAISISKSTYTLNTEQSVSLTATVTTNDGSKYSDLVEWTSDNTKVATVDSNGKVTAHYPGSAIIRARAIDGTERSVVCALTVKQPVKGVSIPDKKSIGVGDTCTLKPTFNPTYATNQSVTWSTSDNTVASVSAAGVVTGKKVGTAVITCKTADGGYTAKCTVSVIIATKSVSLDKTRTSVYVGNTVTIKGTVSPSNATDKTLIWSSSDTSVATVSSTGVVTGVKGGKCTISCKTSGGQSAFCTVTVLQKVSGITLDRSSATLYTGQKYTLTATVVPSTATDKSVNWTSSNSKVATVTTDGVVTGVSAGSAVIIAVTVDGGFIAKCSVTVVKKVDVTGVKLNKTSLSLNKGDEYLLDATVSPSNASNKSITWTSNNTKAAKVSANGLVTAVGNGAAIISAQTNDGGYVAKCTVNVTAQVTGIRLSPSEFRLAKGASKTVIANIFPSDAANRKVTWSSSDTKVVTVNSKGVVTGVNAGYATVTATTADGGYTATCNFTVYIPVTGVRLNSKSATVPKGETILLTAKIIPDYASNSTVRWSSSDSSVASVNSAGQVSGKKVGTATITVSSTDGNYSDTCVVKVVQLAEKITLDYTSLTLYAGKTKTLTAKLKPSTTTNKKITWTSSNKNVATVSSSGKITAVAGGTAVIKATSGDKQTSAACRVTVQQDVTKITLSAKKAIVRIGKTKTITATAAPKTATNRNITWKSSNTKVAKVNSKGVIKGLAKGTATITAYSANNQVKASCKVTVIKSVTGVKLNYSSVTLNKNKKLTLKATIKPSDAYYQQVTWKSSNYDVADVSSSGTVKAKSPGYAEITVKTKDGGYKAVCRVLVVQPVKSVSITVSDSYVDIGKKLQLKAVVKPSNATNKSVVWSSSNKSVAKVSSKGVVTGLKAGTVTITATTVSGSQVATCKIRVVRKVKSITLNKSEMVLYLNNSAKLKAYVAPSDATVKTVKWSSSKTSVLRVDKNGKLTPVKPGKAVITAKTVDGGLKAKCSVSVEIPATSLKLSKSSLTMYSGKTATLTATVSPSNTTNKTITWSSSNTKVATVKNGKIYGVGGGKATITAKTSNGIKKTCTVTVLKSVSSVSLNTSAVSVYAGSTYKLTASVLPSDASNRKVTWYSDNKSVATVNESGGITAVKAGTAVISVTTADGGFKASCKVTVLQHVTSVSLDKTSLVLAKGSEAKLNATVMPADASEKSVKWVSSDPQVVSVSVSGVVTANGVGEATVSVITDDSAKQAVCRINVYESVNGVSIDIKEKILYLGESVTLNASVSPSDASNKSINWSSSDPSVANVSSNGTVTAVKVGEVTVTAKTADGGFTDTCKITVRAHVTGVALSSGEISVSRGGTYQLTASVVPSDSFEKGLIWKSENEEVASVENGEVTANKKGDTVVTVTSAEGGFTASCQVHVTEPVTGISLSENEITVYTGQSATLKASVLPENASDQRVLWTSSDENTVRVENGLITAVNGGTALITAETVDGKFKAVCYVTVNVSAEKIEFDRSGLLLAKGEKAAVKATVLPENTYNKAVIWQSENEEIATVDENGVVTAVSVGKTSVVCKTVVGEVEAVLAVEVYEPVTEITLTGEKDELWIGQSLTLSAAVKPDNASDKTLKWTSDNEAAATVENGTVTAKAAGRAVITASSSDGKVSGSFTLTVKQQVTEISLSQTELTLNEEETATLTAAALPENAFDKTLVWESEDENTVTVDQNGNITAVAKGECYVTVTSADTFTTARCLVRVIRPVTSINISNRQLRLEKGKEYQLSASAYPDNASDTAIVWSSSDPETVYVSESGKVTALKGGTAVITAQTSNEQVKAECQVTVEVISTSVLLDINRIELWENETVTVSYRYSPEDVTDSSVKWTSDNEAVATVENGKITGKAVGTAIITVTMNDSGLNASCKVKVSKKTTQVTLDRTELAIENGEAFTLKAQVLPQDATYKSVSWSTSDKNVAVVDEGGTVTAKGVGTATITAKTDEGGNKATCIVTVTQKPKSITLSAQSITLTEGESSTLTASFLPETTTLKDLVWESSDTSVASVENGKVTAVSLGKAVITAKSAADESVVARCEINVLRAAGMVTLDNHELTLKIGETKRLNAVVGPEGASNTKVTWSTSDSMIITVDENGNVTAVGEGTANITVTTEDGGFVDICFVSVEFAEDKK